MNKKIKKMLGLCLCMVMLGAFSLTAFAKTTSGTGSIGNNQMVSGTLSVSTSRATLYSTVVGYPDLLTTVKAQVYAYRANGTTDASLQNTNTGAGTTTATTSSSTNQISYARGYAGTPSVPSAVNISTTAN